MKDTRIEFRSSPNEKDLFILAAQLAGVNVSVFLRRAAIEAAKEVIQAEEVITLSDKDRDLFIAALDSPPEPSASLKKAMKKYKNELNRK